MVDENCLSLFDDDELRLDELFGYNLVEELLADAADSLCETETTENYSKKSQLENQIKVELDDGDISRFIEEKRNRKKEESWLKQFSKLGQNCEWDKLELLITDTTDWTQQSHLHVLLLKFVNKTAKNLNLIHTPRFFAVLIIFYVNRVNTWAVKGKQAPDSARKVLQPLSIVSSQSEPTSMFSEATFKNFSFTFGSERNLEENSKKRFMRVLSFDSSDE